MIDIAGSLGRTGRMLLPAFLGFFVVASAAAPAQGQTRPADRFATAECATGTPGGCVEPGTVRRAGVSSTWIGAGTGFVVGGIATWVILNNGGSTAPCDRDANQDAMGAGECIGITALGALAGAGIGALIGRVFRSDRVDAAARDGLGIGWVPATGAGIVRVAVPIR